MKQCYPLYVFLYSYTIYCIKRTMVVDDTSHGDKGGILGSNWVKAPFQHERSAVQGLAKMANYD